MGSYFNFVIEVVKFQPSIVHIPVWTHNLFVILWVSSTAVITNSSTDFPDGSSGSIITLVREFLLGPMVPRVEGTRGMMDLEDLRCAPPLPF